MKITVIGGSGFLGSHVADQLSIAGHEVLIFDRRDSSWLRTDQKILVGDLLDPFLLNKAVENADVVYHFAALSDLNEALDKPVETARINILGTIQVLEACRKYNVKRLIYASTVYVYSREGSFYRCSKQASEQYIEEYQRVYNLDYTILRYGSLFGPRSDESNGLYRVIKESLQNGRMRITKVRPEAVREYIHIEDAAKASVIVLGNDFKNESIVLTGYEKMCVSDLMKMIAEILGFTEEIEFIDIENSGHYVRTAYAFQPKIGRKFTPQLHVDLGQGLIQLINLINEKYNYIK